MGLKIKAGMAIAGMAMSWFCGIPFLSGIASHLDTTGNVMVDIADGIGLISKVKIHNKQFGQFLDMFIFQTSRFTKV